MQCCIVWWRYHDFGGIFLPSSSGFVWVGILHTLKPELVVITITHYIHQEGEKLEKVIETNLVYKGNNKYIAECMECL
jgi:hypothetical protein